MRTGIAHLPLHWGKTPRWLFPMMRKLARQITEACVVEFGPHEFLQKISSPFWFQALGAVLGFDWHSSGLTTTVCAALKEGTQGIEKDLGIFIAGGKGRTSRKTPEEIDSYGKFIEVDPNKLIYASRMAAKVDTGGLQDGYTLYHHVFFFTTDGSWAVIQQGMNERTRYARRYHWLGEEVHNFVCEPHNAICAEKVHNKVLNMVASDSDQTRNMSTILAKEKPDKVIKEINKIENLTLPKRHPILLDDINPKRLRKILIKTYERQPENFETLLSMKGVGPKTIRALSLVSELIYGKKPSFKDPARFGFAHGGKDGYPYPVDKINYETTIEILERAISLAKIGNKEKLAAIKRLHNKL
jgi:hypothetical protein